MSQKMKGFFLVMWRIGGWIRLKCFAQPHPIPLLITALIWYGFYPWRFHDPSIAFGCSNINALLFLSPAEKLGGSNSIVGVVQELYYKKYLVKCPNFNFSSWNQLYHLNSILPFSSSTILLLLKIEYLNFYFWLNSIK